MVTWASSVQMMFFTDTEPEIQVSLSNSPCSMSHVEEDIEPLLCLRNMALDYYLFC